MGRNNTQQIDEVCMVTVYCVGDSHVGVFTNNKGLSEFDFPHGKGRVRFHGRWLGEPFLAYNFVM